ncbi:hypothetical protein [Psychrobacter sp. W2-37-MNA-CIBAN-0211]|uniref:hypothetical protein n=1 Tax=Psychrobacter sp. W2-37-MNA-CIBAN-0211 TaxID=3140443 RepID=UPI00331B9C7F
MNNHIVAAKITTANIVGGGANLIAVTTSAAGLNEQLSHTLPFLYLDLPLWFFFFLTFVLSVIGSFGSLFVDRMKDTGLTASQKISNMTVGIVTGLVGAFIILPSITGGEPEMSVMLLTGLAMSFLGTILVRNIGDLARSDELTKAVKSVLLSRAKSFLALFFGGSN